jgi:hypothetical protein
MKTNRVIVIICLMLIGANLFGQENLRPRVREQVLPPASKEKFHIYLLIGESHMRGNGFVEPQDTVGNPRILRQNRAGDWEIAKDPLHLDYPGLNPHLCGVGPGHTFAREMLADAGKDVVIGLVPCAVGSSTIDVWQAGVFFERMRCHPYDFMLLRVKLAMKDGTLKGVLWFQGGNDSSHPEGYKEKFLRFVPTLRSDLRAGDVPFLAAELPPYSSWPGSKVITRVFHEVKADLPAYDVISSEGVRPLADGVHFDAASARELGRRYAEKMKLLQGSKTKSSEK